MYQKWSKIWTIILVIKQGSSTIYCPSQPSIMKCEIQILYQQLKYVLKLVLVIDDCELIQKGSKAKITKVANYIYSKSILAPCFLLFFKIEAQYSFSIPFTKEIDQ